MIPNIIRIIFNSRALILNKINEFSIFAFDVEARIELKPIKKIISHKQTEISVSGMCPPTIGTGITPSIKYPQKRILYCEMLKF